MTSTADDRDGCQWSIGRLIFRLCIGLAELNVQGAILSIIKNLTWLFLVSALMYASVFGNVTVLINRIYATQARYHHQKARVKEFIRFHRISQFLKVRVMESFDHVWKYTHGIDMALVSEPKTQKVVIPCLNLSNALCFSVCIWNRAYSETNVNFYLDVLIQYPRQLAYA